MGFSMMRDSRVVQQRDPSTYVPAYVLQDCHVVVTVQRSMLLDMGRVLVPELNPAACALGFRLGEIYQNPTAFSRHTEIIRDTRRTDVPFLILIDETEITLHLRVSLCRVVGLALRTSPNKAVARLGYELISEHQALSVEEPNLEDVDENEEEQNTPT